MTRWPVLGSTGWIVVSLALHSLPAAADFRQDYKRGIEALKHEEWEQASILFRQALAERPDEKAHLSRSPFSRPYLPQFYLGQARFGMDDCEGALVAWAESARQEVVARLPEYQLLVEGREICQQEMVNRSDWQRRAEVEIANADSAARRVGRLRADLGADWNGPGEGLSTRHQDAETKLRSARSLLSSAVIAEDIAGVQQAAATAREAGELMEAVERDAIQRQAQLRLQEGALRSEVESLRQQAAEVLQETAALRPYPRQLGQLVASATSLVEESQESGLGRDLDNLRQIRGELEDILARLREAVAPPPVALAAGARAHFDGHYEEALELLDGLDAASRRVAAEAHILRAAASFSLYHLGGGSDVELMESARAEVIASLAIDPDRRPPAGPFSPRFLEFFASLAAVDSELATVAELPGLGGQD